MQGNHIPECTFECNVMTNVMIFVCEIQIGYIKSLYIYVCVSACARVCAPACLPASQPASQGSSQSIKSKKVLYKTAAPCSKRSVYQGNFYCLWNAEAWIDRQVCWELLLKIDGKTFTASLQFQMYMHTFCIADTVERNGIKNKEKHMNFIFLI